VLELEYLRVEPFLTVYGEVEESLEIKEDVRKLEARIADLNKEIEEQKRTINDLSRFMESRVGASLVNSGRNGCVSRKKLTAKHRRMSRNGNNSPRTPGNSVKHGESKKRRRNEPFDCFVSILLTGAVEIDVKA